VFYNPGEDFGFSADWCEETKINIDNPQPTAEEIEEARPGLIAILTEQVQEFVDMLRAEGILG
jgi:hypothetical protein